MHAQMLTRKLLPDLAEHSTEQCKDQSQNKRRQGTGGRVQIRLERDCVKRQQGPVNSKSRVPYITILLLKLQPF